MGYLSGRPGRFLMVFASRPAPSIFFTPRRRLSDHLVLIRAGEMPQKSLTSFLINERSERITLRTPPGVQLDRKVAVINDALKRCAI
jgi:hypothetical protein